jgi:histidinol-phosphate aminotransferase
MQSRSPSDVIKPEVRNASAYTLKHFKADVKLDQNENPYELPAEFKREVAERVLARPWGRYPEFVPASVTRTLARFTGWTEDGILVGNGSNELIQASLLVMLGPGRSVVVPQPTFTLYKLQSSVLQANIVTVPLKAADFSFDVEALIEAARTADVVVICSPNNPTGTFLPLNDLAAILEATSGIVLLDEAYHEFSGQTALTLLPKHRNLVVLRTFSKAMSMAGMRFGYMLAHPEIAREVHKAKLPYNVNIFTLTAAELVLERGGVMMDAIASIIQERQRLLSELAKRPGVEAFPSCANFVLLRTGKPAREIFDALYADGILIRDVSSYPMLDRVIRVSVGKPEENNRFLNALDRALEQG